MLQSQIQWQQKTFLLKASSSYLILTQPGRRSLCIPPEDAFTHHGSDFTEMSTPVGSGGLPLGHVPPLFKVLILLGLRQSSLPWRKYFSACQKMSFQPCHNLSGALPMPTPTIMLSSEAPGGFWGTWQSDPAVTGHRKDIKTQQELWMEQVKICVWRQPEARALCTRGKITRTAQSCRLAGEESSNKADCTREAFALWGKAQAIGFNHLGGIWLD